MKNTQCFARPTQWCERGQKTILSFVCQISVFRICGPDQQLWYGKSEDAWRGGRSQIPNSGVVGHKCAMAGTPTTGRKNQMKFISHRRHKKHRTFSYQRGCYIHDLISEQNKFRASKVKSTTGKEADHGHISLYCRKKGPLRTGKRPCHSTNIRSAKLKNEGTNPDQY